MNNFRSYFSTVLLNEYNEAFVNKFAQTLIKNTNIEIDIAKIFIRFFDTIRNRNNFLQYVKDNPERFAGIKDPRDITKFNIDQLEHIYDQFNEENVKKEKNQPIAATSDLIFPNSPDKTIRELNPTAINDERYLEVYLAGNQEKCEKFSHDVFGRSYAFCIGRKNTTNLYKSYRFKGITFYFVRDYSRNQDDLLHLIVVHVYQDGMYKYSKADNSGDQTVTWEELIQIQPKLKNLKHLFKFIPLTEEEEEQKTITHTSPHHFKELSPRLKLVYINYGKKIFVQDYANLSTEEQNLYLTVYRNNNNGMLPDTYGNLLFAGFFGTQNPIIELCKDVVSDVSAFLKNRNNTNPLIYCLIDAALLKSAAYYNIYSDHDVDNFRVNYSVSLRETPRLQPLKFFINKVKQESITGNEITKNLAKTTGLTSLKDLYEKVFNNTAPTNKLISILLNNKIILLQSEAAPQIKFNKYKYPEFTNRLKTNNTGAKTTYSAISFLILDDTFTILNSLSYILDVTKDGFIVCSSTDSKKKFIVNFNNNELNIQPYNEEDKKQTLIKSIYTIEDFEKVLTPEEKINELNFYIDNAKKFVESYEELNPSYILSALTMSRSELANQPHYSRLNVLIPIIPFGALSIESLLTNMETIPNAASAETITKLYYTAGVLYYLAKKTNHPDFGKVKILCKRILDAEDYFTKVKWFIDHSLYQYGSTMSSIKHNSPDNKRSVIFCVKDRAVIAMIRNNEEFKIIHSGEVLMLTKNQIVFGSVASKAGIKKVVCYSKDTLEKSAADTNKQIIDNFDSITKHPEGQKIFADALMSYFFSGKLFKYISNKISDKKQFKFNKIPPWSANKPVLIENKNLVEINIKTEEEKNKYYTQLINYISSTTSFYDGTLLIRYLNCFMQAIQEVYGIELKSVYIHSPKTINYKHDKSIFYRFSIHDSPDQYSTEFYIYLKQIRLYSPEQTEDGIAKSSHYTSPYYLDKNNIVFQNHYRTPSYVFGRGNNVVTLANFCKSIYNVGVSSNRSTNNAKSVLNHITKNIMGTVPSEDLLSVFKAKISESENN